MTTGPSMMLRDDLVEIVARTQQVLKAAQEVPADRNPALREIGDLFRAKGLLEREAAQTRNP